MSVLEGEWAHLPDVGKLGWEVAYESPAKQGCWTVSACHYGVFWSVLKKREVLHERGEKCAIVSTDRYVAEEVVQFIVMVVSAMMSLVTKAATSNGGVVYLFLGGRHRGAFWDQDVRFQ